MQAQYRPLGVAEDYESDLPTGQILLIANVLVGGDKYFKTRGLGRVEQRSVRESLLSAFHRFDNNMRVESLPQRCRRAVIKQNEHVRGRPGSALSTVAGPGCAPQIPAPSRSARA
jgi:hypothetical protein